MKNIKFHKEWYHFWLEMDESLKSDNKINMKNNLDATHLHKYLFGRITNRDGKKTKK